MSFDPASQCRTHVHLNDRFATLRGTTRSAFLASLSTHTADLPSPAPDFLASLLHALCCRHDVDCTQYVRTDCGGRAVLVCEQSRKRFDGLGRVVQVVDTARDLSLLENAVMSAEEQ